MKYEPLAHILRPKTLDDFFGQVEILGGNSFLKELILQDKITSVIFYGPPGTGKSTLANLIASLSKANSFKLNAVTARIEDLRDVIHKAQQEKDKRSLLIIDEIHRFTKVQQEALLPFVEDGTVILIGVTTENPYFFLSKALISRTTVFEFKPLEKDALKNILNRTLQWFFKERKLEVIIEPAAEEFLLDLCSGDARRLINIIELAVPGDSTGSFIITKDRIEEVTRTRSVLYDRDADEHYDTISAFIKSVRGSDPDAALYWAAKMLEGGEPPEFICRRLIILASEDIGNADPHAIVLAMASFDACRVVGMPEAKIILSQAITYCATAPKSNASYLAIESALSDIKKGEIYPVPDYLKDSNYYNREKFGRASGYLYPHDYKWHYVTQKYLPVAKSYYKPSELGFEKIIKKRMEFFFKLNSQSKDGEK